jgi:hypothetical protein
LVEEGVDIDVDGVGLGHGASTGGATGVGSGFGGAVSHAVMCSTGQPAWHLMNRAAAGLGRDR